jgi:transcriptional regulator with XRE-family HTH domain
MGENWSVVVKRYRIRHCLTQKGLADLIGVSQRTISRWERGEDNPSAVQQKRLRDLAWDPTAELSWRVFQSVSNCPMPRALSRGQNLRLQVVSRPAIEKRPSVVNWIGRDLAKIATGVLLEMLDDRILQQSIANGDIACVLSTTESVLRTPEHPTIGKFQTAITYFFHDGALYSDAIAAPAADDAVCGYRAIPMDETLID